MKTKTNLELFNRADAAANEAADKLTMLGDGIRERGVPLSAAELQPVRNRLREALSAVQELKTRLKHEPQRKDL
ncbi:MAG: hypothetical protein KGL39_39650 [Patescibacteria group bacterium]|nr:hypothetical protein [Patescibacteria group bacterium]